MGFLSKLLTKKDIRTPIAKFIDGTTPATMNRYVKTIDESLKVPYAQAMSVLMFSRSFIKVLNKLAHEMPEPLRTSWKFPHDRIFAEVVAFYYFALMKDFLCHRDEDKDEQPTAPYSEVLRKSLNLANAVVVTVSDPKMPENFIINRTIAFSSIHQSKDKSVVDALVGYITKAWNADHDGRPVLDISAPLIPIETCVSTMPVDEVIAVCRDLYEEKLRNPSIF